MKDEENKEYFEIVTRFQLVYFSGVLFSFELTTFTFKFT